MRWGIIPGAAAFVISLLVGSLSHVAFFSLLIRALIFGVFFFGLGVGLHIVINSYLPDLLISGPSNEYGPDTLSAVDNPGSRVNITLGEGSGALPENTDNSEDVGNIADLAAPNLVAEAGTADAANGMDQTPQNGYTQEGESEEPFFNPLSSAGDSPGSGAAEKPAAPPEQFKPAPAYSGPVFTATVDEGDLGGLPDLDAMAGAFLGGGDEGSAGDFSGGDALAMPNLGQSGGGHAGGRNAGGKKKEGFEGDFNPKELAEGIRTILTKEKQG